MTQLTNSHSLTEFQRNPQALIEGLNETKEPMLLTVDGKVQAVLVDPVSYQQLETECKRQRLIAAVDEGERAIREGRTRSAERAHEDLKSKYDF